MSMERFGELLLMERLASGGMAEVFRAKQLGHAGFEKTVAVKRILPHFATSDDFKNMFRLEANLSAMLQHTNITQVFNNGEYDGYLYLVMEFVDGKNLRQLLARADKVKLRIPLEISCYIVSETLKGLDYAHGYHDERTGEALNIVHRDVSPQNVMLGYQGSVKVVDFGIAKAASKSENTRAGVLKGKFGYMSPEQARGEALDRRSDIFSMGIILWELITQRRLFTYEDEMKTLEKVRECKIPRPSEKNPTIPYALEKIVLRALEKDPAARYSTCGEFYSELVRYMNDRHPNFIPTDFTRFMKEFYKEDIAEEKKRREKLNAEAPAFMTENPARKSSTKSRADNTKTNDGAAGSRDKVTVVSGVHDGNEQVPSIRAISPEQALEQELLNTLNQDPSLAGVGPEPDFYNSASTSQAAKKIQVHAQSQTQSYVKEVKKAPKGAGAVKFARAAAVVVVLALTTYAALTYLPTMLGKQVAQVFTNSNDKKENQVEENQNPISDNGAEQVAENPELQPDEYQSEPEVEREPAAATSFIWEPRKYPVYGSVSINGIPDADEIYINGKRLTDAGLSPMKTPIKDLKLPPGVYEMILKNKVFGVSKAVTVTIIKNKSDKIDVILNKR
ncbi:MAG: serine/threonine-protein kinase [Bdellovibrionota bacterium]